MQRSLVKRGNRRSAVFLQNWPCYVLILPAFIYILLFHYRPMYGVLIAFKDFKPHLGVWGSHWVGLKHFLKFFNSPSFWLILKNTLLLSLYTLLFGFPFPIILALALNNLNSPFIKKTIQTVTYAPHFISTVVVVGMMSIFLSPTTGFVNKILSSMGGEPIFFMGQPGFFRPLYVISEIWQRTGWNSIIYLAALSSVDPSMHESAMIDGASRLQRTWSIDLPAILPTVVVLLILNVGRVMTVGFEKAFLMQNPLNLQAGEIIQTYVYKVGLLQAQYGFSSAVGLFNSLINIILLVAVNQLAKKTLANSLW